MKNNTGTTPGEMQLPRALELLNALIDHMIEVPSILFSRSFVSVWRPFAHKKILSAPCVPSIP